MSDDRPPTARELIQEAANDPDLTIDKAALAVVRSVLVGAGEGDPLKPGSAGELIKGMAALKDVGGGEDLMSVLQAFAGGGDGETSLA